MLLSIAKGILGTKALKAFGPLHFFTAGGIVSMAVFGGIKMLATRSKTVEKVLNKGFDVVEDKIGDLKEQVLPEENTSPATSK